MKKIYPICFFLVLHFVSRAQYFALEYDSVSPYVTALPYPMDSYYRVLSYDHSFPSVPHRRTRIKVYDSTQQYVKTIQLLRGITLVNDYPPLVYNKRLLWPANYNDTVDHSFNSLVILELDTNYAFVALHKVSSHVNRALPTGLVAYSTGFVVGEYFNGPLVSNTGFSTRVYKLSFNFQKKDSALFLDELRLKTHLSKNNKIVGASDDISAACTTTAQVTQKIELDTNLVIIDCYNLPINLIYFCYDAAGNMIVRYAVFYKRKGIIFPLSNTRNYVHAEVDNYCPPPGTHKAILSGVLNGNSQGHSTLNSNNTEDTEFPNYLAADCDYYGSNTIYVGTVGLNNSYLVDFNLTRPYYSKLKTKMTLSLQDTAGINIWRKQFGGEMNYYARSVAFTSDGGCVVAGSRYDSAAFYPNRVFQNFLMKVDAFGNAVSVGIEENKKVVNAKVNCYPNPAAKYIYFDLPYEDNNNFQIYNGFGQEVLQRKNYINLSRIDVQELAPGIYFYKIISKDYVYSGKLIKE